MTRTVTTAATLDQDYLSVRAKLLEIAAALDRVDRAGDSLNADPRLGRICAAIEALSRPGDDRAERIQLIFSRPYDDQWRDNLRVVSELPTHE